MQGFEMGGRRLKRLKKVSEGGFGFVHLVCDANPPHKRYALKKIITQNEEQYQAARQELNFLQQHCAKGNQFFMNYEEAKIIPQPEGVFIFYLLLEYCSSGTLFDLMADRRQKSQRFTEAEVVTLLQAVTRCAEELHRLGYAHFDLKIENVLFFDWQTLKLCDFGAVSSLSVDFSRVSSGEFYAYESLFDGKTTLMYRPPEMCDPYLGYRVDAQADMWMIGCIAYTLMFFRHPFVDKSKLAIAMGQFAWPDDSPYSPRLENIVRNLLTPNPGLRPTAARLLDMLTLPGDGLELNSQALQIKREKENLTVQLAAGDRVRVDKLTPSVAHFDFDFGVFDQRNGVKAPNGRSEFNSSELGTPRGDTGPPYPFRPLDDQLLLFEEEMPDAKLWEPQGAAGSSFLTARPQPASSVGTESAPRFSADFCCPRNDAPGL